MDSKKLKNTLKQAKEAVKNKDINLALSLCKAVLKEDRNNYIALVLLGAAFQESDQKEQTPNAFRKAIEISPDQILAWQGLAVFYEKDDCNKNAELLIPVYQRLLQLESDITKWCDIVFKMHGVITKFESGDCLAQIVEIHKSTDDSKKLDALCSLVTHYLAHVNNVNEKHLSLFEEILNKSTSGLENEQINVYLKLLYNQKRTLDLLSRAEKQFEKTPQDSSVVEWICKVCSEEFVDNRSNVLEWSGKLPRYYNSLLENNKDNVLALMAQGAYFISQRAYLEARDCLQHCLSVSSGLFHSLCLLAEAQLNLLCPEQAEISAQAAASLRPEHLAPKVLLVKAFSLTEDPKKWEKAVSLASELSSHRLVVEGLCQALLRLKQWSQLSSALPFLVPLSPALASLLRLELEESAAGTDLLPVLALNIPDCPEAWYRLGQLYLENGSHDLACTAFLKCAKQAPYWYIAYLELGHLYARSAATLDKARRCYQRALVLRPAHTPTQEALSHTFHALGDSGSNLELLEEVTRQPGGQWAWPRLGLQYSELGDSTAAINCLRSALKQDPNQSHLWEALADSYLARGANGSALKSYQKVLELKPGAFYPALQIATIKQITDLPEESLLEFEELVEKKPDSVLALKGLCDTCICLARNFLTRRLLGLARDRLQQGLTAISRAVEIRPEMACLWKLAGDCLGLAGTLPRLWRSLQVPPTLCSKSSGQHTLQGNQLLELAARCMCRSLKLMSGTGQGQGMVWHDLALNYRQQACLSADGDKGRDLCEKALAAAKQSVSLQPRFWQHWNLLGIVAAMPELRKYALAQHAFIKASMLDETVAVAWANLGTLYLSLGQLMLANGAFSAAQRIDSEYCPSWVGQALIAEQVQNEETMDLFRHATQLGYHKESCLGYGQWVCQTLQSSQAKNDPHYIYSIEKMHAVPVAIDALTWATDEDEENVWGLNMLGCLLERCGLYQTSVAVLSRAVDLCPPQHRDKVLANFARVLINADKVEDAIEVYKAITKADIHSQCGLALSLYKGKLYQEACEAYQAALDWWAADDLVKAHLHVALAAVAYKMGGPEPAKTLLLKGNQGKATSVYGLFAACSLGMLNSDLDLSKQALRELLKYQNNQEYVSHIALFQAYIKFIQGEVQASVWSMSKAVHCQPSLAALWLHLALLILHKHSMDQTQSDKVAAAAHCAHTAMALGHTYMDVSKVLSVVSVSQLQSGRVKAALSASQHAVHLYPSVGESWAVLAASCQVAQKPVPLRPLISHARQNIHLERPLAKWMSNFERKIAMLSS